MAPLLLAGAAALLVYARTAAPERTLLVLHESLMTPLRDAEFLQHTGRINLGSARGQRQTVEADPGLGAAAVGLLSRPEADPPFAWLVGRRPGFHLDVVQPRDRSLALHVDAATEAPQSARCFFNGELLGEIRLRDGKPTPWRLEVPADLQRRGRNRVELEFDVVETRVVDGETVPLPVAARGLSLRFLPPEEEDELRRAGRQPLPVVPRGGLVARTEDDRLFTQLSLPAGTVARVASLLPDTTRVVLQLTVEHLGAPFDLTLVPDDGERRPLLEMLPGRDGPGQVRVDLTHWSGRPVRLDLRVSGEAAGEVLLRGIGVLVPEIGIETEGESETERETEGVLEVRERGEVPVLAWTQAEFRLEVDLATRRRSLFDLDPEHEGAGDVSDAHPALLAFLHQELCRYVQDEVEPEPWSDSLRIPLQRQ